MLIFEKHTRNSIRELKSILAQLDDEAHIAAFKIALRLFLEYNHVDSQASTSGSADIPDNIRRFGQSRPIS